MIMVYYVTGGRRGGQGAGPLALHGARARGRGASLAPLPGLAAGGDYHSMLYDNVL